MAIDEEGLDVKFFGHIFISFFLSSSPLYSNFNVSIVPSFLLLFVGVEVFLLNMEHCTKKDFIFQVSLLGTHALLSSCL